MGGFEGFCAFECVGIGFCECVGIGFCGGFGGLREAKGFGGFL